MGGCSKRILNRLLASDYRADQLALDLCLDRATVRHHLTELFKQGKIFRMFSPKPRTGEPDYIYSSVPYKPRYTIDDAASSRLDLIIGDWDANF